MTVYVDDMFKTPIGRFQGDHYDICLSMRAKAVAMGAREITLRELSVMAMQRRAGTAEA